MEARNLPISLDLGHRARLESEGTKISDECLEQKLPLALLVSRLRRVVDCIVTAERAAHRAAHALDRGANHLVRWLARGALALRHGLLVAKDGLFLGVRLRGLDLSRHLHLPAAVEEAHVRAVHVRRERSLGIVRVGRQRHAEVAAVEARLRA